MLLLTFFDSRIAGAWQRQDKLGWKWPEQIHETYPVAVFVSASYHLKEISPLWSSWKRKALSQNIFEITKRWRIFCAWTERWFVSRWHLELPPSPRKAPPMSDTSKLKRKGPGTHWRLNPKTWLRGHVLKEICPWFPVKHMKVRRVVISLLVENTTIVEITNQFCKYVSLCRRCGPNNHITLLGLRPNQFGGAVPANKAVTCHHIFFGGTYPNLWKEQNRMFTPGKTTPTIMNPHYYFMKSPFSVWKSCQKLMSIVIFYVYIYDDIKFGCALYITNSTKIHMQPQARPPLKATRDPWPFVGSLLLD